MNPVDAMILVVQAKALCERVVEKCENRATDGRKMRSQETYQQCKEWLAKYKEATDGC